MNGYEKHSPEYGGPDPGWGTRAALTAIAGVIAYLTLRLIGA